MAQLFISHSSDDKPALAEPLFHFLTGKGHRVWYDQRAIGLGDSIPLEISEGLASATIFIVIASSSYNESPWCRMELGAIIANCTGTGKRMFVIRTDDAPLENLVSHLRYLSVSSAVLADEGARSMFLRSVADFVADVDQLEQPILKERTQTAEALVSTLMVADRAGRFGQDLLERDAIRESHGADLSGRAEGLLLIKPRGTFYEPCLTELLRRIASRCYVCQMRIFDGLTVQRRNLFRQQYVSSTKLATGEIGLNDDDLARIRFIYDTPEFAQHFGVPYSDTLVTPALRLEHEPYNLAPEAIARYWEVGRSKELFRNGKWNGLNKIGYQKTVFPIVVREGPNPQAMLVLNGFIPGLKQLFEAPDARTIAIHVRTSVPWREIRENLVGGESDPRDCAEGSIRRDAYDLRIPLDPRDAVVNGQRNVCHSSATLVDGLRELVAWFEYRPVQTILGSVLSLVGTSELDIEQTLDRYLEDLSWTTRDDTFAELFYEVRQGQVFDSLKGAQLQRNRATRHFVKESNAEQALVDRSEAARSYIENGVRWAVGGEEYYLFTIAKTLFQGSPHRGAFYETARELTRLHKERWGRERPEIIAEAVRIAASDLRLLDSPVYKRRLHSRALFVADVLSDLPEQALACAERTRLNLVTDLVALVDPSHAIATPTSIADTDDWKAFAASAREQTPSFRVEGPVALILAGGRSTRIKSTIPKPVFPFGNGLLFDAVAARVKSGLGESALICAAVGFRSRLVQRALGETSGNQRLTYLTYPRTLGLAFRVATALEALARAGGDGQWVLLTYTDMPALSTASIRRLVDNTRRRDGAFGMLVSVGTDLSGHVEERDGRAVRIIQQRLRPELCSPAMKRDVGLYVFRNDEWMRSAVLSIRNDNVRGEFIFADVLSVLAAQGQEIVLEREEADASQSVNTVQEWLQATAAPFLQRGNTAGFRHHMAETLGLAIPRSLHLDIFHATAAAHTGPLYFFPWWERMWLSKQ
jgi:CTP:molybdopterin cytidylyltransferase MocA